MKVVVLVGIALLVLLRALAAAHVDLFGDEAFYWMCAQHLAPAYTDHPFLTALLVRVGTWLAGDTTLGVRLLFLMCGAALPFAILALARPIVGARNAWLAAGASQCLPMLALAAGIAVPDVPLLLLAVGVLLFLERATRTGRLADWLGAGACGALGLSTHYRFALVVGGAAAWLLFTRHGRAQWRGAGPWLAGALTLMGLLPVLVFNVLMDWRPLRYQLGERHAAAAEFTAWLKHPLEQGVVVTPFLYAALMCALWGAVRRARAGDSRRALLACFALVPLGTYFVMSPFSDRSHDYLHWPLVGYLPLLVLLPDQLQDWWERGRLGRAAALLSFAVGLTAVVLGGIDLALGWPGVPSLHGPFAGWTELVGATRTHLAEARASGTARDGPEAGEQRSAGATAGAPLVLADNYVVAAQLNFRLGDEIEVYVADHAMNHRYGRALQFEVWGLDEAGFARHAGERALVVEELSAKPKPWTRQAWDAHLASLFEELVRLDTLKCSDGDRAFRFYAGRGVRDSPPPPP